MSAFSNHAYELIFPSGYSFKTNVYYDDLSTDSSDDENLTKPHQKLQSPTKPSLSEANLNVLNNESPSKPVSSGLGQAQAHLNVPIIKKRKNINDKFKEKIVDEQNYEVMFEKTFIEGKKASLEELILFSGGENNSLKEWIGNVKLSSIVFQKLKHELKNLFTSTREDKLYETLKKFLKNYNFSLILDDRRLERLSLKNPEIVMGLHLLIQHIYEAGIVYSDLVKEGTRKSEKETDSDLYYVIGFILNKLLRPRSSDEYEKIGKAMSVTEKTLVPVEYRKWTEAVDRGGLNYPNVHCFDLFKAIQNHVGLYYNETFTTSKKKKALNSIHGDKNIKNKWVQIYTKAGVAEEQALKIMDMILKTYLNTIGKGHTNKLNNEYQARVRARQLATKYKSKEKVRKKIIEEVTQELSIKQKIIF